MNPVKPIWSLVTRHGTRIELKPTWDLFHHITDVRSRILLEPRDLVNASNNESPCVRSIVNEIDSAWLRHNGRRKRQ